MAKTLLRNISSDYSRREVVVGLAAATMMASLPVGAGQASAAVNTQTKLFLDISAKLTGIPLDGTYIQLGGIILGALTEGEVVGFKVLVDRLGPLAPDPSGADINKALEGESEETMALARKVTKIWYTGQIQASDGKPTVITYDDALVWQACDFSKPPTTCGGLFGYWAEPYKGEA